MTRNIVRRLWRALFSRSASPTVHCGRGTSGKSCNKRTATLDDRRSAGETRNDRTATFNRLEGSETTDKIYERDLDKICNICCCNGNEVTIPKCKVTDRCSEERTVCESCMKRHIREVISKGQYEDISCICRRGCNVKLSHPDVKRHADTDTFATYDTGLLRAALARDPEFCWCARPGCGSGQLHVNRDSAPIMSCHACRFRTCFTHHCEWHSGRTCAQYDRDAQNSEEVALLQTLQNGKFKRCPKCSIGIEKNGGCDHMTCRRERGGCGEEFCWLCLASYDGPRGIKAVGNKAHKRTCQHYM